MEAKKVDIEHGSIALDREASDRLLEAMIHPRPLDPKLVKAANRYREAVTSGRVVIEEDQSRS